MSHLTYRYGSKDLHQGLGSGDEGLGFGVEGPEFLGMTIGRSINPSHTLPTQNKAKMGSG